MIYQTDFHDNINIYKSGCLFMSLIEIAQRMADRKPEKRDINNLYKHCVDRGFMKETCYINDHNEVLNDALNFLIKPDIRAQYSGAYYIEKPEKNWGMNAGKYKIVQVKTANQNSHFMVLDNVQPYDPWFPAVNFDRVLSIRYYDLAA